MQLNRRTFIGLTAASLLGAGAAGCVKSGSVSKGNQGNTGNEDIKEGQNDINRTDPEQVAEGGVLVLPLSSFLPNFNAVTVNGSNSATYRVKDLMSPRLFDSTSKGEFTPNPNYLKRGEVISEDSYVVEMELLEGMKWSDGTPLDYKSIANAIDLKQNAEAKGFDISSNQGFDQIKSYEQGANAQTIKITFDLPFPDWRVFMFAVPDSLVASADAFNTGWEKEPKVTCGPFALDTIDTVNKKPSN